MVMYHYPSTVSDELINKIANSKKVLKYIDIPIQHVNNDILASMKRTDSKEKTTVLINKIREAMPDAVLRTTVIVGYPGETEDKFQELLEFIKWAKFDALGCFPFYPEEGTEAADLENQVAEEVKQTRVEEVMLTQQEIAFEKNRNLIGKTLRVVYDGLDQDGCHIARYYGQAPDIDSVCIIKDCQSNAGEFVDVKVVDSCDYDIVVETVN